MSIQQNPPDPALWQDVHYGGGADADGRTDFDDNAYAFLIASASPDLVAVWAAIPAQKEGII